MISGSYKSPLISGQHPSRSPVSLLAVVAGLTIMIFLSGCAGGGGGTGGQNPGGGNGGAPKVDPQQTILKIFVNRDGVYKLNYDTLKASGFNVAGINPKSLKLSSFGNGQWVEIPIHVSGEDDEQFNSGDFLEFYGIGIPRDDRRFEFTETNVYWLSEEAGVRKRMVFKNPLLTATDQDTSPVVSHLEKDTHYWQNLPDENPGDGVKPDRWLWGSFLQKGESRFGEFLFNVSHYSKIDPVRLTFRFQSRSPYPGHRVKVFLNFDTHLIADSSWDGLASHTFYVDVTASDGLQDGVNSLKIENASDNDLSQVYLDWFEVSYQDTLISDTGTELVFQGGDLTPRRFQLKGFSVKPDIYDITDYPSTVYRITPEATFNDFRFADDPARRYVAAIDGGKLSPTVLLAGTTGLKSGTSGVHYIVITHENFVDAIKPLVQYREGQGLKVLSAKMGDVYDEFSGGVVDPLAIKDFLKYAYGNNPSTLRYALLVGDATYDYKNHLPNSVTSYVPTYLYEFVGLGEVPSDNWFADLDEPLDDLPDIAIGRIPAKTPGDVDAIVKKTIDFESGGHSGNKALFIAEDPYETISLSLVVKFFPEDPDRIRLLNRVDFTDIQLARNELLGALDPSLPLNSPDTPPWLVNYIGHGAVVDWGREEWFRSKSALDLYGYTIPGVDNLTLRGFYSILLALNCLNGNFALPDDGTLDPNTGLALPVSMSEAFLLARGRGAVAVWADSAYGFPSEYELLANKFYTNLFDRRLSVGEAAKEAIREGWLDPGVDDQGNLQMAISKDMVATIIYFGDPAVKPVIP